VPKDNSFNQFICPEMQ